MRHINDTQWTSFCNSHLKRFEKKWTTKLEDYKDGKLIHDSDSQESDGEGENGWKDMDDFKKPKNGGRPNSGQTRYQKPDDQDEDNDDNDDDAAELFMKNMLDQGLQKRQDLAKRDNINIKPSRENLYKVENKKGDDKQEEDTAYFAN